MLTLRPYQDEAIACVTRAYGRGISRPLIALPTGTGKTVVFSHLVKQRPGRCLVLVHRDELIRQAYEKLTEILPDVVPGVVKAQEDDHHAPVVIASVQTLAHQKRLDRITWDFATVIVDEAHHAVAPTYRRILDRAGSFTQKGPLTLGVTATPTRGDRVGLEHVFQKIVYRKSLLEMIMAGYLADLRAVQVHLHADFRQLRTRAGDFVDAEVANMLLQTNAPEHILAAYQEHAPGRKALLFTPTVHLAELMAELFNSAGIPAECVSATTPLDDRRALLHRFRTGETRVITNCGVLTEGYDEPSVDCVIVARPTQSTPLFTQMVGRGTRLYPGKADCLVIDVVGATTHHHLASVASLTGLPLHALRARTVREVQEELEQYEERKPAISHTTAQAVDLFRQRPLHWLKVEEIFSLSLGDLGWILLSPEGNESARWRASIVSQNGEHTDLASGYSLPYIQGIAEDHARKVGAGGLTNPKAYWRQNPTSDKQINILRYLRVPHALPLTMGEASDLITQEKMREAVMRAAARGFRVAGSSKTAARVRGKSYGRSPHPTSQTRRTW